MNQESNTKNVKLGPCKVIYGGVDLGYTKGGVEVTVETSTHEVLVDQFGEAPINEYVMGRSVTVAAPLAETTKNNLEKIMPGTEIKERLGIKASGSITFNQLPVEGDKIVINGETFTFKDTAALINDIAIGATTSASASATQVKLAASLSAKVAIATYEAEDTVVKVEYKEMSTEGNAFTISTTSSGITVPATLSGGVNTVQTAVVSSAVGTSLLEKSKKLVLHPIANAEGNYEDDLVIPAAGVAGAMSYSYTIDNERTYPTEFKGYPKKINGVDVLFWVGPDFE